ncbi:MAG: ABC transporter permease [Bacteroidaceae bacterium]|nr:ABC transporter permease [Bacteroidaceae bacterium]
MKIAFKNFLMTLKRYKVASLLNVLGLTLAFVAFYIIASQVWYSITYNHSLKDAERTYLISPDFGGGSDGELKWSTNSPGALAYEAAAQFPDAEEVASIMPYPLISRIWLKQSAYNYEPFNDYVYQGTVNIPTFFGFECLAGDFSQLKNPNTIIMARSEAEKLGVGAGDVIYFEGGKFHNDGKPTYPQTIVAIYEDMPNNTMFEDWKIMQSDDGVYTSGNNNWNYSNFVRMREGADLNGYIEIFKNRYAEWFLGMVQEWIAMTEDPKDKEMAQKELDSGAQILNTRLVSVDNIYYGGSFTDNNNFRAGTISTPIILSSIAFTIVLIAFINFINFFFALVPVRMRAVNICKVFGAGQGTLRWNFLFEAIGLVLISMALTLYLMIAIQDSFIMNYSICSLALSDNIPVIIMVVVLMVLLAVVAALYPAFYITRFNASLGVKGGFAQSATGRRLRSVMVGAQFSVAMILIIVTAVFFIQYRYMINYDLGFERENIVTFASWDLRDRSETVIERLQQHPDVENVTASAAQIFRNGQTWGRVYNGAEYVLRPNAVRWNLPDFFGFEIVDGVGFTPSSGERGEMITMKSFNREIGIPVGYHFQDGYDVVGTIKDVRLTSLAKNDDYHAFYCTNKIYFSHFYIRLRAGADVKAFAEYVANLSKELAPAADEAELHFLEEWVEGLYAQTKKDMVLIGLFALIAIVIALMGVFGIVMFETQHRRAEIAVRKVYGATTGEMVKMLNLRYVWIVVGCFVVAAPVAWYISSRWLEQFANRIAQPWWLYIASLLIVLVVTVSLVTLRSWKAATENPAEVVKSN